MEQQQRIDEALQRAGGGAGNGIGGVFVQAQVVQPGKIAETTKIVYEQLARARAVTDRLVQLRGRVLGLEPPASETAASADVDPAQQAEIDELRDALELLNNELGRIEATVSALEQL